MSPSSLRTKADRLRQDAATLLAPVAAAFRRRAAELELQAYLLEQQLLPVPAPVRI